MQPAVYPPTVYLNTLLHGGKPLLKYWHRPNPLLRQRLQEAPWVKYSRTYGCFVSHRTEQNIELTRRHFAGLAAVNTSYLDRAPRLKPAEGATVIAQKHESRPLQRVPERPVVRLVPLQAQDQTLIRLSFAYDREIFRRLRGSRVAQWLAKEKCFTVPAASQALHTVADELAGAAWLWLAQGMQIKDLSLLQRLWEQSYAKGPEYIACPPAYLERLFLRNYSLTTIRTYHSLLLRFLNGYADKGKEAIDAFTAEDINHYHRGMVQAGKYSVSLINQSINAVKFYYHQVLSRPDLPLNEVERPEKADRLPLVLSKEEVQKILQGTENLKHRCLLQLLYAGGLRIGELINLKITDI
jgi:integrase/recombinase XerD